MRHCWGSFKGTGSSPYVNLLKIMWALQAAENSFRR
jgi:hypothetical protein